MKDNNWFGSSLRKLHVLFCSPEWASNRGANFSAKEFVNRNYSATEIAEKPLSNMNITVSHNKESWELRHMRSEFPLHGFAFPL